MIPSRSFLQFSRVTLPGGTDRSSSVADIIPFAGAKDRSARGDRRDREGSEIIVFPRTNIRVLRRLWGLPEYGLIVAGPDGRAIGARRDDASVG
jgi:hypothetical protein